MAIKRLYGISDELRTNHKLIEDPRIKRADYHILKIWLDLCLVYETFDNREDLLKKLKVRSEKAENEKIGYSPGGVSSKIKILKELGVITESRKRIDGHNYKIELFQTIEPLLLQLPNSSNTYARGRFSNAELEIADQITNEEYTYLQMQDDTVPVILRLLPFLLAALPTETGQYESEITYKVGRDNALKVKAICPNISGDEVCLMSPKDFRLIYILQGELRQAILNQYPENFTNSSGDGLITLMENEQLAFDAGPLARLSGFGKHLDLVHKAMNRIRHTKFVLTIEKGDYFESMLEKREQDFQFFTEYQHIEETDLPNHKLIKNNNNVKVDNIERILKRRYQVKFHSAVVRAIEDFGKQSFIGHPKLKTEKSDYPHLIYLWCKARIGTSKHKDRPVDNPHIFTVHDLCQQIHPASKTANFQRNYLACASKYYGEKINLSLENDCETGHEITREYEVNILGYIHRIFVERERYRSLCRVRGYRATMKIPIIIEIRRDPADKYVGDNSAAAQAARREVAVIEAEYKQLGLIE